MNSVNVFPLVSLEDTKLWCIHSSGIKIITQNMNLQNTGLKSFDSTTSYFLSSSTLFFSSVLKGNDKIKLSVALRIHVQSVCILACVHFFTTFRVLIFYLAIQGSIFFLWVCMSVLFSFSSQKLKQLFSLLVFFPKT